VVGERDGKPGDAWPGRDGAKAVAERIADLWSEAVGWTLPPHGVKDIREWLAYRQSNGLDITDACALKAAGAELLTKLTEAAKAAKSNRRTQADLLVEMAQRTYRFGVSLDGEPFAVRIGGQQIALLFRGGKASLRSALAKQFRMQTGMTPSSSALMEALTTLEGIAQHAEPELVALRL